MRRVMRGLVGVLGVFILGIGLAFLLAPAAPMRAFFVEAVGVQGMATVRADFAGFFVGAAVFALLGAWRGAAGPLNVPLVMLGVALLGRCVSQVVDGPGAVLPMLVEAGMIGVLLAAQRVFRG